MRRSTLTTLLDAARHVADDWNARHPVGTPVRVKTGRGKVLLETVTRSRAAVIGSRQAALWVNGYGYAVPICHLEVIEDTAHV